MRDYAEHGELCEIVGRTGNCAISHSPPLNVASAKTVSSPFVTRDSQTAGLINHCSLS